MADILDQIQQRQAAAQEQQLAQADTNNIWAQTFNSIPASDKVFAAQDLNDMIARVTAQKKAAIEASDPKIALAHARTQEVLDRTKHNNDMAEPAIKFKEAQFRAQQALERNRLAQETLNRNIQTHQDNFAADMAQFHTDNPSATQEQIDTHALAARDAYPHAMKNEGIKAAVSEAVGRQKAAAAPALAGEVEKARQAAKPVPPVAGFVGTPEEARTHYGPNATIHETAKGVWTATEKPVTTSTKLSPEQKIVAQEQAMTHGALSFGHLDEKGKLVPDAAGGEATHVSAFYTNPITGKMDKTPPMTIAEFQTFEKKAKEAAKDTTKALDADTATKILGEAGGDKEKARQLAKERGFHF